MPVPAFNLQPVLDATRDRYVAHLQEMFAAGRFILGPQVEAFENELAAAFSARHAIGVGSGTDAIQICLRAAIGPNPRAEVITSALTAPFTGIAVLAAGCSLRLADIDPNTLQIDPIDAGNRITKRTTALLPVHLYGQPCDLPAFVKLARAHNLALIQDACQAHGATYRGRPFTSFSPYVAYSFYPTKNLGCLGDGGAILTSNFSIARRLRILRDGGRNRGGQIALLPGINSRLDEIQACYLRAFLPFLAEWNAGRRRTAAIYDTALRDCPSIRIPDRTPDSVCHLYVIRAEKRDKLRAFLASQGIGTGIHYPAPLHLHPAFYSAGLKIGALPNAERACREVLSLPVWPYLPTASAELVASQILAFYRY